MRKKINLPVWFWIKLSPTEIPSSAAGICDSLYQNREQVAQAYFEVWTI